MCICAGEGQSAITKTLQMYLFNLMIYRALFISIYISKIGNPNFRPFQFDLRTRSQKMCEKYDKNDKLDLTTAKIIHKKSYIQDPWFAGGTLIHIIEIFFGRT